jgi:hypothetical protein
MPDNYAPPPPPHTHTHSEYVILIAFPRKQRSGERASQLRYTYSACLVEFLHSVAVASVHDTKELLPAWPGTLKQRKGLAGIGQDLTGQYFHTVYVS